MKTLSIFILLAIISFNTNAQIVNIPDTNFYKGLLANGVHDSDGYITADTAKVFTGLMNLAARHIADLTGISAFTAIDTLYCLDNSLTSLDLSANASLIFLDCSGNNLTSLDMSSNKALEGLNCSADKLINLNISSNISLAYLNCEYNSLTSLDASSNTALIELLCAVNNLANLNVLANRALTGLNCSTNSLTSLDVSSNIYLSQLLCSVNSLTSLDASSNSALTLLDCSRNSLTSLNVSSDTAITNLYCEYNNLTSLDVKNGNNHNMLGSNFFANNNPMLTCIEVDDTVYSKANWTHIDSIAHFSTDCNYVGIDEIKAITDVIIYPNPVSSQLILESKGQRIVSVIIYNTLGQIVNTQKVAGNETLIDMSIEPSGIYYIHLTTDDERTINKKIVKQ